MKSIDDNVYMRRAIQLAKLGRGNVSPNPLVGSVIVCDGKIIGEGYHRKCGEGHAEVNAINSVADKSLLSRSTIYVTLEPCSHQGKTPPCASLIIANKIPNVVIGSLDPHIKVAGKGIKLLVSAGMEVKTDILKEECEALNPYFLTFHRKKRPYIILKWAQSSDGFMDKERKENTPQINWITHPETQQVTHGWRAEVDAILVGKNTVLHDNPSLTVRANVGSNPIRIVLDSNNELDLSHKIFNTDAPTIIFNYTKEGQENNIRWIKINSNQDYIKELIELLYILNIQSVIVEGGNQVIHSFMNANFWDEARILSGSSEFKNGMKAPILKGNFKSMEALKLSKDQLNSYTNA